MKKINREHIPITDEQVRINLNKLVEYLSEPKLMAGFNMNVYSADENKSAGWNTDDCGTAGCAAGHGPYAGVNKLHNEGWSKYIRRCFIPKYGSHEYSIVFLFLFGNNWYPVDNTPIGAAWRIAYALEHGVPCQKKTEGFNCDYVRNINIQLKKIKR